MLIKRYDRSCIFWEHEKEILFSFIDFKISEVFHKLMQASWKTTGIYFQDFYSSSFRFLQIQKTQLVDRILFAVFLGVLEFWLLWLVNLVGDFNDSEINPSLLKNRLKIYFYNCISWLVPLCSSKKKVAKSQVSFFSYTWNFVIFLLAIHKCDSNNSQLIRTEM